MTIDTIKMLGMGGGEGEGMMSDDSVPVMSVMVVIRDFCFFDVSYIKI